MSSQTSSNSTDNENMDDYDYTNDNKKDLKKLPYNLRFNPDNYTKCHWRKHFNTDIPAKSTKKMMIQINKYESLYKTLNESAKKYVNSFFLKKMVVRFVFDSNIIEDVGLQDYYDTRKCLETYLQHKNETISLHSVVTNKKLIKNEKESKEIETINTLKAMEHLQKVKYDNFRELKDDILSYLFYEELILKTHKILMENLTDDSGKFRETTVISTNPRTKEIHYYPEAQYLENRCTTLIDNVNDTLQELHELNICDSLNFYKLSAYILYHCVTSHFFSDGNGRLCRLLSNYIISLTTPFPVPIYIRKNYSSYNEREIYLLAIQSCRDDNIETRPNQLTSILIENSNYYWKKMFRTLIRKDMLNNTELKTYNEI